MENNFINLAIEEAMEIDPPINDNSYTDPNVLDMDTSFAHDSDAPLFRNPKQPNALHEPLPTQSPFYFPPFSSAFNSQSQDFSFPSFSSSTSSFISTSSFNSTSSSFISTSTIRYEKHSTSSNHPQQNQKVERSLEINRRMSDFGRSPSSFGFEIPLNSLNDPPLGGGFGGFTMNHEEGRSNSDLRGRFGPGNDMEPSGFQTPRAGGIFPELAHQNTPRIRFDSVGPPNFNRLDEDGAGTVALFNLDDLELSDSDDSDSDDIFT